MPNSLVFMSLFFTTALFATPKKVYYCYPKPMLMGTWTLEVYNDSDTGTYTATTYYRHNITPHAPKPQERHFEITRLEDSEGVKFDGKNFHLTLFPSQSVSLMGGKPGIKAQVVDIEYVEGQARLKNRSFVCAVN